MSIMIGVEMILFGAINFPAMAFGCSCVGDLCSSYARADVMLIGTVVSPSQPCKSNSSDSEVVGSFDRAELIVEESFKGDLSGKIEIYSRCGGCCTCEICFQTGHTYVIAANWLPAQPGARNILVTNACQSAETSIAGRFSKIERLACEAGYYEYFLFGATASDGIWSILLVLGPFSVIIILTAWCLIRR